MKTFRQFILETGYMGDIVDTEYNGQRLGTGVPTELHYLRRKQKSQNFGSLYGQDIEPAGKYVTPIDKPGHRLADEFPREYESGTLRFNNPLIIRSEKDDPTVGWKKKLSAAYGGRTGIALSKALVRVGHDGIITVTDHGPSETVSLHKFHSKG